MGMVACEFEIILSATYVSPAVIKRESVLLCCVFMC